MSYTVTGRGLYGQVDRVPGMVYVATVFWHIQTFPIVPLGSYLVIDGSDDGSGFEGKRISFHWKSIVVGYLRYCLGTVAVFTAGASGFAVVAFFLGHRNVIAIVTIFAVIGLVWLWCYYILSLESTIWFIAQAGFHGVSFMLWMAIVFIVAPDQSLSDAKVDQLRHWPSLLVANCAMLCYCLTRYWRNARGDRVQQLKTQLTRSRFHVENLGPLF